MDLKEEELKKDLSGFQKKLMKLAEKPLTLTVLPCLLLLFPGSLLFSVSQAGLFEDVRPDGTRLPGHPRRGALVNCLLRLYLGGNLRWMLG